MANLRRYAQDVALLFELLLRGLLLVLFIWLEYQEPFFRKIHKEEAWLYANPMTDSYVPASTLWPMVAAVPAAAIALVFLFTRNLLDAGAAVLCASLLLPINGIFTNVIKLSVGRPRPDFLQRCWPDGHVPEDAFNADPVCTGDETQVADGRKSFPSGHASFAFATFGFVFFYLSGKMRTFSVESKGRLNSYRIVASLLMLLAPTCIAISRTCDYHHHWQDVVAGSLLGLLLSWTVYRFYYPPLESQQCDQPYLWLASSSSSSVQKGVACNDADDEDSEEAVSVLSYG